MSIFRWCRFIRHGTKLFVPLLFPNSEGFIQPFLSLPYDLIVTLIRYPVKTTGLAGPESYDGQQSRPPDTIAFFVKKNIGPTFVRSKLRLYTLRWQDCPTA